MFWDLSKLGSKLINLTYRRQLATHTEKSKTLQQKNHHFLANVTDMLVYANSKFCLSRDFRTLEPHEEYSQAG